jgi:hypothetical protein
MKKIHLFFLLGVLVLGMSSCKYDEGPFISFVSISERVANSWVVNTATINGGTSADSIAGFQEISFFKEGACQIIYDSSGTEYAYVGDWALTEKKKAIHIDAHDELTHTATYVNDWTISRLKDAELKVTYQEGGDTYVVDFEPK